MFSNKPKLIVVEIHEGNTIQHNNDLLSLHVLSVCLNDVCIDCTHLLLMLKFLFKSHMIYIISKRILFFVFMDFNMEKKQ